MNWFTGKTFAITGTFAHTRGELSRRIQALGGVVKSTVTREVDYLLIGESPGADKTTSAAKRGINTVDAAHFYQWLNEAESGVNSGASLWGDSTTKVVIKVPIEELPDEYGQW